jgi:hypothetical protein
MIMCQMHFAFFDTSSSSLHNRTNDGRSLIQTNFVQHYISQYDMTAWGASLTNALRNLSLPSTQKHHKTFYEWKIKIWNFHTEGGIWNQCSGVINVSVSFDLLLSLNLLLFLLLLLLLLIKKKQRQYNCNAYIPFKPSIWIQRPAKSRS